MKNRRSGFTLIEAAVSSLLLVILVSGVGAAWMEMSTSVKDTRSRALLVHELKLATMSIAQDLAKATSITLQSSSFILHLPNAADVQYFVEGDRLLRKEPSVGTVVVATRMQSLTTLTGTVYLARVRLVAAHQGNERSVDLELGP